MADLNHVSLIGRLTRDSELKYTASGQAVCKFAIAVNRRRKSGDQWVDEPNFFDIVLWGRQGESLSQYLIKGKQVGIDGELRQDRWEQDGQNRSRVEVIANNLQLLGGGSGSSAAGTMPLHNRQETSQTGEIGRQENYSESFTDDFTDDIPF